MLVFFDERLVFLSVPKTGTTAWQQGLAGRADIVVSDPPELKHAPVYRYNRWFRPMFEKVCGVEMEVMAVMREPVSWLGSWYRYRRRPFMAGRPNSTEDVDFETFVYGYTRGQRPPYAEVGSQAKFLERQPNGTGVDHLFRYEDQESLRAFLESRLGGAVDLPGIANASPEAPMELSAGLRAKLERKCTTEFDLYASIG
ncbi:MAG: gamma-glutamyl kinase [Paracoccaceae bacterium]